jgi:hypothetical protein
VADFIKIGQASDDIIAAEKKIDIYVELLQREALKETISLNELQRTQSQLEGITSKNASKEIIEKITQPLVKVGVFGSFSPQVILLTDSFLSSSSPS